MQRSVVVARVAQGQGAVTAQVDVPDLNVRFARAQVVLPCEGFAQALETRRIMDRRHRQRGGLLVVKNRKQTHVAHQLGRQVLADETFVLEITHRVVERRQPRLPRDVGEPLAVFFSGVFTNAFDVGEHRKAKRIRVDAAVGAMSHRRLIDHIGVGLEPLDHHAIGEVAVVIERVEQVVVPERGPAFIHDLGLALRIKVLGDFSNNADDLALPRLQQRGVFFDEVQDVFLQFSGETFRVDRVLSAIRLFRQRAPQVIHLRLRVLQPFLATC